MNGDAKENKRIPGWLKAVLVVLVIVVLIFGKKYYTAYKHPYRDSDIIGTWDYGYSITFDVNENWKRADEDRYNPDLYIDSELTFNDDGTFSFSIEGHDYEGTWCPDEHVSNLFYLSSDSTGFDGIIDFNEIRWDREADRLFFSMTKDTVADDLKYLFEDDEVYRDVYFKTYRDRTKIVYRESGGDYDPDDWDDDGDNGLPFNYHP